MGQFLPMEQGSRSLEHAQGQVLALDRLAASLKCKPHLEALCWVQPTFHLTLGVAGRMLSEAALGEALPMP